MLKISRNRFMNQIALSNAKRSGAVTAHPNDWLNPLIKNKTGKSAKFTSGPAAIHQRVAAGLGGGFTYATPPSGQSIIWFAVPPTCRQAKACPNS